MKDLFKNEIKQDDICIRIINVYEKPSEHTIVKVCGFTEKRIKVVGYLSQETVSIAPHNLIVVDKAYLEQYLIKEACKL